MSGWDQTQAATKRVAGQRLRSPIPAIGDWRQRVSVGDPVAGDGL
jgi:hypothetical protein